MNSGRAAFGLSFLTFFLNGLIGVCGIVRGCISNVGLVKILSMIGNSIAIVSSAAAIYVWHTRCYTLIGKEIKNNVPSTTMSTLTTAAGFNTCVSGFAFLVIIFLIHTLTPSGANNTDNKHVSSLHEVYTPTSDERGNASFHGTVEKETAQL
jgi:hypothetical protein